MTIDDTIRALREALEAGHTPLPWHAMGSKLGNDFGILTPDRQNVLAETFSDIRCAGESALVEAGRNAQLIEAAVNAAPELLAELDRLRSALRYQEDRDGRIGTHGPGCYAWGHGHYECALAEVERLRKDAGRSQKVEAAAALLLREHLDNVEVHPCDRDSDRIRAAACIREVQALFAAMQEPQP